MLSLRRARKEPPPPHQKSVVFPPHQLPGGALAMLPDQQTLAILSANSLTLSITFFKNNNFVGQARYFKLTKRVDLIKSAAFIDEESLILIVLKDKSYTLERWNLSKDLDKVQIDWNVPIIIQTSFGLYNERLFLDLSENQVFFCLDRRVSVLSLSDGKEIRTIDNFLQQHLQMNKMDSSQLIAISGRAELQFINKNTFETVSTINLESMMLKKLLESEVYRVNSVTQDGNGNIYLAITWYTRSIRPQSGIYDSSYYLVTLRHNMIILERNLFEFETDFIEFDKSSKILLKVNRNKKLNCIRLKEFTLFENVSSAFADVSIL